MLILSRKRDESVVVGDPQGPDRWLVVSVLEINGRTVRLGFEATAGTAIHRWEVWQRIQDAGLPDSPTGPPAAPVT